MLILLPRDVEYCHISDRKFTKVKNNLSALKYQGHFFIKAKSYDCDRRHDAISYCRELLDRDPRVQLPIILKEPTGYSIWLKKNQLISKANHSASALKR